MTLEQYKAKLEEWKKAHIKADVPSDVRVDEDYLDYGDSITRPSMTLLHRVHITSANRVEMTTDCARFFCIAANHWTELIDALTLSIEVLKKMADGEGAQNPSKITMNRMAKECLSQILGEYK